MIKFISYLIIVLLCQSQENELIQVKPIYTLGGTGYVMDINFAYNSLELVKKKFNKKSVTHNLILKKGDTQVFKDSHSINLGDDWNVSNNEYFDRFKLNVPPATYSYTVQVASDEDILFEKSAELTIPDIIDSTFRSSLTIFNSLKKWSEGNEIFKYYDFYEGDVSFNNTFVIGRNNAMFWYFELYNLPNDKKNVSIDYNFYNEAGDKVRNENKVIEYNTRDLPVLGFYNVIAKLKNGAHRFEIEISVGDYKEKITKYIHIIKEVKKPADIVDYSMINVDVDKFVVMYRLEGNELDYFEKLDDETKRKYIKTYYTKIVETQKISFQQLRKSIDDMAEFVSINYGAKFNNYLKSDMARLLFKYGQPNHIERVTSDPEYREHEIWHYDNLINGVKFYLADPEQLGMRIMHADHQRMGYWNQDWKRRIARTTAGN